MIPKTLKRQTRILRTVVLVEVGLTAVGAVLYEVAPVLHPILTVIGGRLLLVGAVVMVAVRFLTDFGL